MVFERLDGTFSGVMVVATWGYKVEVNTVVGHELCLRAAEHLLSKHWNLDWIGDQQYTVGHDFFW